jgi:signal peptidase II
MHGLQAERRTPLINRNSFWKIRRIIIWVSFISCSLDLISKQFVLQYLGSEPISLLGRFLQLHLTYNAGAAFSFAPSATLFFSSFSLAIAVLTVYLVRRLQSQPWAYVAGLVLGGISGNLLDRIFRPPGFLRGEVVDWIQIPHWPTFNLADSAIFIAALLACILTIRNINPMPPSIMQTKEDEKVHD